MNTEMTLETLLLRIFSGKTMTVGKELPDSLIRQIYHHPALLEAFNAAKIPRAIIAHSLNILLLNDLLGRVPEAGQYLQDKIKKQQTVLLDHGALRTVQWHDQALPPGYLAFSRILEPLGYKLAGKYPLSKLKMCGFVFTHAEFPEHISQFFISELYPSEFSISFQNAVDRVLASTCDPLSAHHLTMLDRLRKQGCLDLAATVELLPAMAHCFQRQHNIPSLADYQTLLDESPEMAWIATEGNVFNHVTDRVGNLLELEQQQRKLGRPLKPNIEVGRNANIKQTAYRATQVSRCFLTPEGPCERLVPGSFFEFIERGFSEDGCLDLRFDSQNAQGIFKMTDQANIPNSSAN